jgi:PAS domain S-box-containing protein
MNPEPPRQSEELPAPLLSRLLRLSHDAIFVWRQGGVIEFWNRGAEDLYGYAAAEALGRRPLDLLAKESFPERSQIGASLRSVGQWAGELRHHCRGGREVIVSSRMQLVHDGGIDRVLETNRDITESKRAEQSLRDEDRRKDEFLATLAHELRNPLAPIRNGLAILKLSVPMQDAAKRTTEMMDRQLTHLVRLIDDLLDVSRITRGKVELRMQRVSLAETLAASLESCRDKLEAKRLALETRLGDEPLVVDGDPDRLMQVFSNLLTNAINYTDSGGRVALTARREGAQARVSVEDSGIGIPAGALENVFEMFAQLHPGVRGEAGLGIGLALVRQLVTMHGGTVEAASEGVGRRSTFVVRLPLAAAVGPAAASESAAGSV